MGVQSVSFSFFEYNAILFIMIEQCEGPFVEAGSAESGALFLTSVKRVIDD
jgi:hypothetical protein